MMKRISILAWLALSAGMQAFAADETPKEEKKPEKPVKGHVFAWPFMDWKEMQPRGGMTQGSEVTLLSGAKEA